MWPFECNDVWGALDDELVADGVRELIEGALADGAWGPDDREQIHLALRDVTRAQADELLGVVAHAINSGRVRLEM